MSTSGHRCNPLLRLGERLPYTVTGRAAVDIVAIEDSSPANGIVKIIAKGLAKLTEFVERAILQLFSLGNAIRHGASDLLVCPAEWNAFVHEIGRRCHGVHMAGRRGGRHLFRVQTQSRD